MMAEELTETKKPKSKRMVESVSWRFTVIAFICIFSLQLFQFYLSDWSVLKIFVGLLAGVVSTAVVRAPFGETIKEKSMFWIIGTWTMAVIVIADLYTPSDTIHIVAKFLIAVLLIAVGMALPAWLAFHWSKERSEAEQ